MKKVFQKPESMTDVLTTLCAGCGHGVTLRLIAEVIQEMGLREEATAVIGVGCSTYGLKVFNFDSVMCAHGRAPAVATGVKHSVPDKLVFTLQGDGDFAAIGTAEAMHAAARGEKFTVFFLNNGNYANTGGHIAPTSVVGQVTKSSPTGRDPQIHGYPLRITEMLALQEGVAFVARVSYHNVASIKKAKRIFGEAFEVQRAGLGLSLVEVVSSCPSGWMLDPLESMEWIEERILPIFPEGYLKRPVAEEKQTTRQNKERMR